ncbi:T9SS C-terminal target domain-containing protein, partial [candidate division KSB1 bacterium]|nr:T9SS C-terminal target domain-containing protein [candidate division KSB1 bacterium]
TAANNNRFVDPQLRGISRTTDGGLDPRPASGSPALTGAATPPSDGFFVAADYLGAFGNVNWAADWTLLSALGILTSDGAGEPTKVEENKTSAQAPGDFALSQNYPNPFNPSTKIDYAVTKTGLVRLAVYNVIGQKVATLVDGVRTAGSYTVTWEASNLASGVYVYRLEAGGQVYTRKLLLAR